MEISRNVQRMEPSITMAVTDKAKAMKAQGIDVISMSAGEPDFDTPENIKEAAYRAIQSGFTKYTPAVGIPELREAICQKFKRDNDLDYEPSEVVVSCGAKHSIFIAVMAILNPGDEVIIPAPYWVTYTEQPKLAGGNPVLVKAEKETGLKITPGQLKDAVTPKTRLFMLNSPSNPSGAVYTKEELEGLADVLLDTGVWVISDEMYESIIYDGEVHYSIAALRDGMKDQTITVNGVSKTYAMTGWRIGYAAGPGDVIKAMGKIQSQETSNPSSISQMAALEAITGSKDAFNEMLKAFDERRRYILERLNSIEGASCITPKGSFYAYPDVSSYYGSRFNGKAIEGSVAMCTYLLDEAKVACVPGAGFGTDENIRLSYATSMENIEKALDRIEEGLSKLDR